MDETSYNPMMSSQDSGLYSQSLLSDYVPSSSSYSSQGFFPYEAVPRSSQLQSTRSTTGVLSSSSTGFNPPSNRPSVVKSLNHAVVTSLREMKSEVKSVTSALDETVEAATNHLVDKIGHLKEEILTDFRKTVSNTIGELQSSILSRMEEDRNRRESWMQQFTEEQKEIRRMLNDLTKSIEFDRENHQKHREELEKRLLNKKRRHHSPSRTSDLLRKRRLVTFTPGSDFQIVRNSKISFMDS